MRKFKRKVKGESILEVVMALAIVSVVLIGAYSSLSTSISTNVSTGKRIIALNLAREGIEAVRNNRDTNWLSFFGSRRDNWDCYNSSGGSCTDSFSTTEEYFITDFFNSPLLKKISPAAILDIENTSTGYADFLLKKNVLENNRYEHTAGDDSVFYRQVAVQKESNTKCTSVGANNCTEERLKAVVRVQWKEENGFQEFKLETYLYDFFERGSY